ncbi:MAG: MFS transporter [Acidobacteria bacterium]|nr:MAG: MFS transporter [Acidobacteriota bacterium]
MSASLPEEQSLEAEARARPGWLRQTFSALHYRDFRLLWIGAFTSTTGTFMQTLAQAWLVYSMTNSAFLLGVDGFLSTGPMLLFSLFGGVIADRVARRKIMLLSQYLQMSFALILALLIYLHQVKVWHIFVMSFLTGSTQSFSGPAYASLLPLLVERKDVPNAIAMNSMQFNLARFLGPALGGVVFAAWGAAACFTLNGISFIAVIIALSVIRIPPIHEQSRPVGIFHEMKEGFHFVITRRSLLLLTFLSFASTFLGVPLFTMLPVVAKNIFNLGARGLSLLQADYGIGSVVGAIFVAGSGYAAKKGKIALLMQLVFAICLGLFGLSRNLVSSLLIGFVAGACIVGVVSLYSSLVQLMINDSMRGRVMSIFMLAFRGGMPLGNLAAGYVAQRWSISLALAVNGAILAAVALIFIVRGTDLDVGTDFSPSGRAEARPT